MACQQKQGSHMELNTCFLAKSGCPLVDPKGALTKRLLDFVHGAVGVQSRVILDPTHPASEIPDS